MGVGGCMGEVIRTQLLTAVAVVVAPVAAVQSVLRHWSRVAEVGQRTLGGGAAVRGEWVRVMAVEGRCLAHRVALPPATAAGAAGAGGRDGGGGGVPGELLLDGAPRGEGGRGRAVGRRLLIAGQLVDLLRSSPLHRALLWRCTFRGRGVCCPAPLQVRVLSHREERAPGGTDGRRPHPRPRPIQRCRPRWAGPRSVGAGWGPPHWAIAPGPSQVSLATVARGLLVGWRSRRHWAIAPVPSPVSLATVARGLLVGWRSRRHWAIAPGPFLVSLATVARVRCCC